MTLDVSRLLDGQYEPGEASELLHHVADDPSSRDRYTIYGLIGDIVRGNSTPDDGFTRRILDRMHREGARIEPGYDPLTELPEE